MVTRGTARWLLAVALAAPGAPLWAQTPPAAQAPAAATRSLGQTVLLANASDHTVDAALRDALSDPDPRVRLVAGRAIAVVPHAELVEDVVGALAREQDPAAAGELARDLLYLAGAGAVDIVMVQARRFGPAIAPVIAEWTGRVQPERLIAILPDLARLAGPAVDRLATIVEMSEATHAAHRAGLQAAWRAIASDPAFKEILERRAILRVGPRGEAPWRGPQAPAPGLRTMPAVAPGVIAGTLASAGCKLESPKFGTGGIGFNQDGRPRRIEVDPRSMSKPCATAFTALARLAVADEDYPIGQATQSLMLPLVQSFVDCSSEPIPELAPLGSGPPRTMTPPRKIKDVKPWYPEDAQRQRIQGVIVIRSVISASGCVSHGRVLRSIPYLDWPALAAVSQWAFDPPRVDRTPYPIVMTVTVNFTLR